jgi:Fem-1 family protein b
MLQSIIYFLYKASDIWPFIIYHTKLVLGVLYNTGHSNIFESTYIWHNFNFVNKTAQQEEKIEALELLGASYANDKDNYDLSKAYEYLHRTMVMRYSDPNNIIPKPETTPVAAYDNWVECRTLEELEAIQFNPNALQMESLSIRERILGSSNPEVPHPVIFRGAVFADNARFDRCIDLWMHALRLRQINKVSVVKDLLRFAQVREKLAYK